MAKAYDEKVMNEFKDKLNTLIAHEEQGIEFEKIINPDTQPVVRTISVAVYRNVIKILEDHFANASTATSKSPQKRNYTKKLGRKPKAEIEQEAAATTEQ